MEPKKIGARKEGDNLALDPGQIQSEDELVGLLVDRVRRLSGIIGSLSG